MSYDAGMAQLIRWVKQFNLASKSNPHFLFIR